MAYSQIQLPSNRKFGFFFTLVFSLAAGYFYIHDNIFWLYVFIVAALTFLSLTLIKADVLLPINRLWMRFGLLLGIIVSPLVLGLIFFGIFTPTAYFMRLIGRDELHLKLRKKPSYWVTRSEPVKTESFKKQF